MFLTLNETLRSDVVMPSLATKIIVIINEILRIIRIQYIMVVQYSMFVSIEITNGGLIH